MNAETPPPPETAAALPPSEYNPLLTAIDYGGLERRDSRAGFRLSLAFHIGLAVFVVLKSIVFPGSPIPYVPTLRVDIVDLPDALKQEMLSRPKTESAQEIEKALKTAEQEAKKIEPKVAPEDEASPDELVLKPKNQVQENQKNPQSRQKKLKNALARIRSLEKISAAEDPDAKPIVIKGNKISKGTSLSGDAREAAEATYFDLIRDRLQENWSLPVWLTRQKYSAQVLIFLDSYGRLKGLRFTKSSGNAQFDEAVKRTVAESDPFPKPPENIQSVLLSGIPAGFPL